MPILTRMDVCGHLSANTTKLWLELKDLSVMHMKIYQQAAASYNFKYTPEAIYCIDTEQVKDIFKYNYGKKETKKQKI